jgi:epoxyqueuosine reductase
MLINSKRGSWFVLGFVLTTVPMPPDEPAAGSCGTCRKCIDACPTGAIVQLDGVWSVDARRCISYLTIEAPDAADHRIGDWTFGCDVCQDVCPFNERRESQPLRAAFTEEPDFRRHSPLLGIPLSELVDVGEEAWDQLTRGAATRRSGWEGLRRVARLNLRSEPDTKLP